MDSKTNFAKKESSILDYSYKLIGRKRYNEIYKIACDTLQNWIDENLEVVINKLPDYHDSTNEFIYSYKLDSLFLLNKEGYRFIGVIQKSCIKGFQKGEYVDGIEYLYGEIINRKWYFWPGEHTPIHRSSIEGNKPNKPLSYKELHDYILYDVFSNTHTNYDKETFKFEVNEEWFLRSFEKDIGHPFEIQDHFPEITKGKKIKSKKEFYKLVHLWEWNCVRNSPFKKN